MLVKLLERGELDSLTFQLSVAEPLPDKVNPLPSLAYHLVEKAARENQGQRIRSTIDGNLQEKVTGLVGRHYQVLAANHIYNMAVVVSKVSTGEVKAYVGMFSTARKRHGNNVDVVQAQRSTGSILKRFCIAKCSTTG